MKKSKDLFSDEQALRLMSYVILIASIILGFFFLEDNVIAAVISFISGVTLSEEIIWNNDLKVSEQSQEAQEWYNENVYLNLSFHIPKAIKEEVAVKLGLEGNVPEEETDKKTPPFVIDSFARPKEWILRIDDLRILLLR